MENLIWSMFLSHPSEHVSCILLWKSFISNWVLHYSTEGIHLGSLPYKLISNILLILNILGHLWLLQVKGRGRALLSLIPDKAPDPRWVWIHLCQQPVNSHFSLGLCPEAEESCSDSLWIDSVSTSSFPRRILQNSRTLIQEEEGFLRKKVFELYLCFWPPF